MSKRGSMPDGKSHVTPPTQASKTVSPVPKKNGRSQTTLPPFTEKAKTVVAGCERLVADIGEWGERTNWSYSTCALW